MPIPSAVSFTSPMFSTTAATSSAQVSGIPWHADVGAVQRETGIPGAFQGVRNTQSLSSGNPPSKRARHDATDAASIVRGVPRGRPTEVSERVLRAAVAWRALPDEEKLALGMRHVARLNNCSEGALALRMDCWGHWKTLVRGYEAEYRADQAWFRHASSMPLKDAVAEYRRLHPGPIVIKDLLQFLRSQRIRTLVGFNKILEREAANAHGVAGLVAATNTPRCASEPVAAPSPAPTPQLQVAVGTLHRSADPCGVNAPMHLTPPPVDPVDSGFDPTDEHLAMIDAVLGTWRHRAPSP